MELNNNEKSLLLELLREEETTRQIDLQIAQADSNTEEIEYANEQLQEVQQLINKLNA